MKPLKLAKGLGVSPSAILRVGQREVLQKVRQSLTDPHLSSEARRSFARAMTIKIQGNRMRILVKHPGWIPVVEGQPKTIMRWLTHAKAPIPIVTDTGRVIFRWASPRAMANGQWMFPGRKPTDVPNKLQEAATKVLRERVEQAIRQQLRQALGG